jgi:4-hydroxybenzoate polyprenyltransferase
MTTPAPDPADRPARSGAPEPIGGARRGRGGGVDWRGHVAIARLDHWFKNVFVLPGIVVATSTEPSVAWGVLAQRSIIGLLAVCLIASSNYTLNEILDAPFDRFHPAKRDRPVPSGRVKLPAAWAQWLILFAAGMALSLRLSVPFALSTLGLWLMACVYNVPPVRSKDQPYVDVLTEAVNNPLRMLAGWFIVTDQSIAPASLLLSYWMIGSYFMALKRYAELNSLENASQAAAYRRSFAFYTPERLIVAIMFYAAAAMLFFGAFCMRYRLELILSFPLVALVMAIYLRVALKPNSAAQHPERLYRERALVASVSASVVVMVVLLRMDLPAMHRLFTPTAPAQYGPARN